MVQKPGYRQQGPISEPNARRRSYERIDGKRVLRGPSRVSCSRICSTGMSNQLRARIFIVSFCQSPFATRQNTERFLITRPIVFFRERPERKKRPRSSQGRVRRQRVTPKPQGLERISRGKLHAFCYYLGCDHGRRLRRVPRAHDKVPQWPKGVTLGIEAAGHLGWLSLQAPHWSSVWTFEHRMIS